MSDLPRHRGRLEAQSVEIALLRRRIAELEDERDVFARTLDKRDTRITDLEKRYKHFTEQVNVARLKHALQRDGYTRAHEQDKQRIAELEAFVTAFDTWVALTPDVPPLSGPLTQRRKALGEPDE